MLINIAWRNVWRHPIRSAVVIAAIALGLWAGIFMMSFSFGLSESRTRDVLQTQTSHVQIHPQGFERGEEMQHFLENGQELLADLRRHPDVTIAGGRILTSGMLESTQGNFGVQIIGVDPEVEAELTRLESRVIGGEYLEGGRRPVALIGEALAKKIGVIETPEEDAATEAQAVANTSEEDTQFNFRRNLVIRFQGPDGEITAARFKVTGVYQAQSSQLEESQVFVRADDLQRIVGREGDIQEIAMLLSDAAMADTMQSQLAGQHPDLKVETWSDLAPEINFLADSMDASLRIFVGVILLALAFGIVNTMLMAVMERTRELGMLMSIGMNRPRVFAMIMLETVFLTVAGAPIGLLAGWGFTEYFATAGIDLSAFEQGMDEFGMASIVYTDLPGGYYGEVLIMVVITALLSALYPAWKALRLNPAEAVRAI